MSHIIVHEPAKPAQRRPHRVITVVTATAMTGLAWWAGRMAKVDYVIGTPMGPREITLMLVVLATIVAGSAAWAVCALVERRAVHPRRVWVPLAAAVLGLSIVPIFLLEADLGTRVTLSGLHCVAAAVLITGLPLRRNVISSI